MEHTPVPLDSQAVVVQLCQLVSALIHCPVVAEDTFHELALDSIAAMLLILQIEEHFNVEISIDTVLSSGHSVRQLAELVANSASSLG